MESLARGWAVLNFPEQSGLRDEVAMNQSVTKSRLTGKSGRGNRIERRKEKA